jgi:L-amino acid N-acyltransferase YncA
MTAGASPGGRAPKHASARLQIRKAKLADAPDVAAIYNEAVRTSVATFDTEPRSLPAQESWLQHHDDRHPVLVADEAGSVVGWASLSPWSDRRAYDDTAEVSVYVRADRRSEGVGRALLSTLVRMSEEARLHVLLARIADGNEPSVRLHDRLGFRSVGVMHEVGFKFGRRIDVHLFERIGP